MTIIADPLFYLLCIPAIVALGLGKGGFAGVGMISTPLLALSVPPLQAAAILLPILLCQDAISAWAYRREWSAWNLKVLLPGAVIGVGAAWLFAAHMPNAYVEIVVGVTGICFVLYMFLAHVPAQPRRPSVGAGMFWGALAGFTSTIIQVGAPPYQVHILPQRPVDDRGVSGKYRGRPFQERQRGERLEVRGIAVEVDVVGCHGGPAGVSLRMASRAINARERLERAAL
jgi:hypothetical protein